MTTRETLIAARAWIDTPEKWTQGVYHVDGARCMGGALMLAAAGRTEPYLVIYAVIGDDYSISSWNDQPGRTHAEVMEVFDRAIEAAA